MSRKSRAGLGVLIAVGLNMAARPLSADAAQVVRVNAVVKQDTVQLEIQANAPFEYTTYRPSATLYLLDLSGVTAVDPSREHVVASSLVKSYFVVSYVLDDKPVVRVELVLTPGVDLRLERKGDRNLVLLVSRNADSGSTARIAPSAATASVARPSAGTKPPDTKNAGANASTIDQVRLAKNGEATEVSISGSGPLKYHAMHLQNPDRLALDFADSSLNLSEKLVASSLSPVRQIRLGQFSAEVSRVVIDLGAPARYSIQETGNTVTISFKAKPVAAKR